MKPVPPMTKTAIALSQTIDSNLALRSWQRHLPNQCSRRERLGLLEVYSRTVADRSASSTAGAQIETRRCKTNIATWASRNVTWATTACRHNVSTSYARKVPVAPPAELGRRWASTTSGIWQDDKVTRVAKPSHQWPTLGGQDDRSRQKRDGKSPSAHRRGVVRA
jgi:hypothetical protein